MKKRIEIKKPTTTSDKSTEILNSLPKKDDKKVVKPILFFSGACTQEFLGNNPKDDRNDFNRSPTC